MSSFRVGIQSPRYDQVDWRYAECAGRSDSEMFYKQDGEREESWRKRQRAAKELCSKCRILIECGAYGYANEEHGVWGGLSEEDRRDLRKRHSG